MRNKSFIFVTTFIIISIMSSQSFSLKEDTHQAINEHVAQNTIGSFSLNNYLMDNLGLMKGVKEELNGVDTEGKKVKKRIFKWLGYGGFQEDRPGEWYDYVLGKPTRSVNHFHNPLIENWDDAGLDDWVLFFHYTGQSSVLWSQNPDQDPDQNLGDEWSWPDAREYYYIALTGRDFTGSEVSLLPDETEEAKRERYFADTFRGVGQLMHLIEDASVPEHVRNDIHILDAYEAAVERFRTDEPTYGSLWDDLIANPITFDESILDITSTHPSAPVPVSRIIDTDLYISTSPDPNLTTAYCSVTQSITCSANSDCPSDEGCVSTVGISEYTNANFLSPDTIFTADFPYPDWSGVVEYDEVVDGKVGTYLRKLGYANGGYGERIEHLAVGRWGYKYLSPSLKRSKLGLKLDEQVYTDYASLLLPRAVGYSAGLLDYFFRGEVDISKVYEQRDANQNIIGMNLTLMNLTTDEEMKDGKVWIAYQYKVQGATDFTYGLSDSPLSGIVPYEGEASYTFSFPTSIPADATDVQYTFVFKGTLGQEEGAVIGKVIRLILNVVWGDDTSGNFEIYHMISTDGGATWGGVNNLSNAEYSVNPSVAAEGSNIYVVWEDYNYTLGNYEIFFSISTDDGATWTLKNISENSGASVSPSLAVDGSNIYVVWTDYTTGNAEIYLGMSTDGGATWTLKNISQNSGASYVPSIAVDGSNIYVAWRDYTTGNAEIYLGMSTDGGAAWTLKNISQTEGLSSNPSIAVNGSNIYVVWTESDENWNDEIYLSMSTDGGATWTFENLFFLESNSSSPSVAAYGSNVYVVWSDDIYGNWDVVLRMSTDGGATWGGVSNLSSNTGWSLYPSVVANGSDVYVAWQDGTTGNNEIYLGMSNSSGATWTLMRLSDNAGTSVGPAIAIGRR